MQKPGLIAVAGLAALSLAVRPFVSHAAAPAPGPPLEIVRAAGPIAIDGDLSDPGWTGVQAVTAWYETRVSESAPAEIANEGYLAYDDRYLYAGFRFADPEPHRIRAPFADHDQLSSATDYGGVIIDSRNDGKSAILFLANANGLLYDAVTNDASGEDSAPDFFWESAGRIAEDGWTLEIRIPFSSLRFSGDTDQTWGIMLYRNYPRDRHYQFFSNPLPRDVSCFICNSSKLTGLSNLPRGSHLVVAPYATAQRTDRADNGLGSPLVDGDLKSDAGLDVKWSPLANLAIDATVNPDFSQVEADVAQIGANERFALFFPEKRSFFLEGKDLFATPFQAVHTRSITAPEAGLRATGRAGQTAFTALVTRDEGGGSVILPGPEGSDAGFQDFRSDVAIFRARRDLGRSFLSFMATGRSIEDGGHNVVAGPDFEWRPGTSDQVIGQALFSSSRTPDRPDLGVQEWDGRSLDDQALLLAWSHTTRKLDWYVQGQDLGPDFRADQGFIPQVGYREAYGQVGYTVRPEDSFFSRIRVFTINYYDADYDGNDLNSRVSAGAGMDGRWNSFFRVELNQDRIKVGPEHFTRFRPYLYLQARPGRVLNDVYVETHLGEEIDFANARKGTGVSLNGGITVRPDPHLELNGNAGVRWVNVDDPTLGSGRVFTAQVERLRATWQFNGRSFLRLIGQYEQTTRDTSLYTFTTSPRIAAFSGSALFAYKLNWQTVFYLGYGDDRRYAAMNDRLEKLARGAFLKVSYALQQ